MKLLWLADGDDDRAGTKFFLFLHLKRKCSFSFSWLIVSTFYKPSTALALSPSSKFYSGFCPVLWTEL